MDDLRKNGEGYPDPTAYEAIKGTDAGEEHAAWRVKQTIWNLADLAGFRVEGKIVLTNKRSRKVY